MNIRLSLPNDLEKIMDIWLRSTIHGHPFIKEEYWLSSKSEVESKYIPQSTTFVTEKFHQIVGFISILDNKYIGALFIDPQQQGCGIGSTLIKQVQTLYPELFLEVYIRNQRAHQFYLHQGFKVISNEFNQDTQEKTHIMYWSAGKH